MRLITKLTLCDGLHRCLALACTGPGLSALPAAVATVSACSYIDRRAKEEFHALAKGNDTAAAEAAWQRAQSQLAVWKRQSVVYGLYGRRVKTVMVSSHTDIV
jgi:hypothetical protein